MSATSQAEQTALTLPQRATVALGESANEAKLRELVAKSACIISVTNPDGREEAHRTGMVLLKTRTGIEKTGKAAREDATAFSKAVIAMEKDLIGIIQPEETRVLALRDQWDEQIAAEKAAKIAAERQRTESIQADIQSLRDMALRVAGQNSAMINASIEILEEIDATEARFAEFAPDAAKAMSETIDKLVAMHATALVSEAVALAAEEARKAEALRIEQERAALAAQRAENERIANEQAAERQRLAALQAAQEAEARRVQEQAAANLRAEREAQETAMRLERERNAAEQARAMAELDAKQAALDAARIALELKLQLEGDHAEALEMNALVDATAVRMDASAGEPFTSEADRARCTATAQAMLANGPRLAVDAIIDTDLENGEMTDAAIIEFGAEYDLRDWALVERLEEFCEHARAEMLPGGQHYSTTTFKDNGDPILLNADNSRSVFCDVDE